MNREVSASSRARLTHQLSFLVRTKSHQSGSYMQMHDYCAATLHQLPSMECDAIYVLPGQSPVIALLMNSAVQIDCGQSERASERTRKSKRARREEPIASMQSVAPNEFWTGWKNRWRVIYDDVYINEKCASGRRHVALSFLRGRQSSRSPTDDQRLLLLLLSMRRSFRPRPVISMSSNRRSLETAGS